MERNEEILHGACCNHIHLALAQLSDISPRTFQNKKRLEGSVLHLWGFRHYIQSSLIHVTYLLFSGWMSVVFYVKCFWGGSHVTPWSLSVASLGNHESVQPWLAVAGGTIWASFCHLLSSCPLKRGLGHQLMPDVRWKGLKIPGFQFILTLLLTGQDSWSLWACSSSVKWRGWIQCFLSCFGLLTYLSITWLWWLGILKLKCSIDTFIFRIISHPELRNVWNLPILSQEESQREETMEGKEEERKPIHSLF